MAFILKNTSSAIQTIKKRYWETLFFTFRFLNFKANMGTSETKKALKTPMSTKVISGLSINKLVYEYAMPTQKSALAGVGKPINEDD